MQIEIKVDAACREPKIIVITDKMTDEINDLIKRLSKKVPQIIVGFKDDCAEVLEQQDILRVFASLGKTMAQTSRGEYQLRFRLYELEEQLNEFCFARISNSEIINLKKVKSFDLNFAGTICVTLINGTVTYVSRRYVAKIKQILGI